MGKLTTLSDAHLELFLVDKGDFGSIGIGGITRDEREIKNDIEDLHDEVKRRIRKSDGLGHVNIKYTYDNTCEHCGYLWTEESDVFNGGCCEEDLKSEPKGE